MESSTLSSATSGLQWSAAFLRWVLVDLPPTFGPSDEPFLGFVYMDRSGLSVRGGRPSDPEVAERPSVTIRLPMEAPGRILADEDVAARGLPAQPGWLRHFGAQPPAEAPWRVDPELAGRFEPAFLDDLQVLVHDGERRRTGVASELCWVRITDAGATLVRRTVDGAIRTSVVYGGTLLNQPHRLTSVRQGDRVQFLADAGAPHPMLVADAYLTERPAWAIDPCDRCGFAEAMDPPSVLWHTRFGGVHGVVASAFTSFCPLCGGTQMLRRVDG